MTDMYNLNADILTGSTPVINNRKKLGKTDGNKITYDFVFVPNDGFLNSNKPLVRDCEIKLSFDRAIADVAFIRIGAVSQNRAGKVLEITNCFALTEYVSSESLRKKFDRIDTSPLSYHYQNCEVTLKNIPLNEKEIRIDNIKGGNNPSHMFVGVIPTKSINGDFLMSSTGFHESNVLSINITLNGKTVNGYPIENHDNSPIMALQKFYDATNRYMNVAANGMTFSIFKSNWLYAHKFEAESTSQGWIGIHLELSEPFITSYTLVVWSIQTCALTVDKFHQIEKLVL